MIKHPVSISLETYTQAIAWLNLGEVHPTLIGGALWYPPDESASRDKRIFAELAQQGLTSGDRISDDFAEALTVMQRPALEYYTIAYVEDVRVTARSAVIGRDAVLVVCAGGAIDIEPIPHDQLGVRMAAALPDTPAARMRSLTCDVKILQALEKDKPVPSGPSTTDAKHMHRWLKQERINSGELHVAIRNSALGTRTATQPPLSFWIDTEAGRGLLSPDASGWMTLSAAGTQDISNHLGQLEKQLRAGR